MSQWQMSQGYSSPVAKQWKYSNFRREDRLASSGALLHRASLTHPPTVHSFHSQHGLLLTHITMKCCLVHSVGVMYSFIQLHIILSVTLTHVCLFFRLFTENMSNVLHHRIIEMSSRCCSCKGLYNLEQNQLLKQRTKTCCLICHRKRND